MFSVAINRDIIRKLYGCEKIECKIVQMASCSKFQILGKFQKVLLKTINVDIRTFVSP